MINRKGKRQGTATELLPTSAFPDGVWEREGIDFTQRRNGRLGRLLRRVVEGKIVRGPSMRQDKLGLLRMTDFKEALTR